MATAFALGGSRGWGASDFWLDFGPPSTSTLPMFFFETSYYLLKKNKKEYKEVKGPIIRVIMGPCGGRKSKVTQRGSHLPAESAKPKQ